jgi:hypothetical protein
MIIENLKVMRMAKQKVANSQKEYKKIHSRWEGHNIREIF